MSGAPSSQPPFWRGAALFATGVLVLTVLAATLTPAGVSGGVTAGVEMLSSRSGNTLRGLSSLIPLGFAFSAGMAAAVNPCGFVMLPAYLGVFMGHTAAVTPSGQRGVIGAVRVSGAVTLGFVALFGVVGVGITAGLRSLTAVFPWLGLVTGISLIGVGSWLLFGGALTAKFGGVLASKFVRSSQNTTLRAYVGFGLAYALTSLSCTLPIFLAVVGSSLSVSSVPAALGQFVLYALGMGSVILLLSMSLTLLGQTFQQRIRGVQRVLAPLGAVLMTGAGAYTVYYWLTVGGLLELL